MKIDESANDTRDEAKISSEDSKVAIYTIPTDEELVIVRDTVRLVTLTNNQTFSKGLKLSLIRQLGSFLSNYVIKFH